MCGQLKCAVIINVLTACMFEFHDKASSDQNIDDRQSCLALSQSYMTEIICCRPLYYCDSNKSEVTNMSYHQILAVWLTQHKLPLWAQRDSQYGHKKDMLAGKLFYTESLSHN